LFHWKEEIEMAFSADWALAFHEAIVLEILGNLRRRFSSLLVLRCDRIRKCHK
jgi:hypothetical protein